MKVSSIPSYRIYNNINTINSKKHTNTTNICSSADGNIQNAAPSFKGSDFYKTAGFLVGTALCTIFAPGLVMIGLGGLGAGTGSLIGAAIDEQIDESKNKDDQN